MRNTGDPGLLPAAPDQYGGHLRPGQNRVRVLAEVVNDTDEIAFASAAFHQQGWLTRLPREAEGFGDPEKNRVWLVVELRFSGSTRSAAKQALRYIEQTAQEYRLGVWVRRVEVVEFPRERRTPYYVDADLPDWLASRPLLARMLARLGVKQTTGLLMDAPGLKESAVREHLAAGSLGKPNLAGNSIRPAVNWALVDDAPAARTPAWRLGLAVVAAAAIVICGLSVGWVSSSWKAIPLAVGIGLVAALVVGMSPGQPLRQRFPKLFGPTVVLAGAVFAGTTTPHHNPGFLVVTAAGLGVAFLVARGVVIALRDSWIIRQAAWGVPLTLTLISPMALYLGGAFDTEYLARFGIPSNALSVSAIYRLAIAARSILLGLVFFLIALAVIGWARHFYALSPGDRWIPLLLTVLTLAVYLLTTLSAGLLSVNHAANRAASAARDGHQPASYYGIQGILECVKPITRVVPVYDAPLPSGRPVLSFGVNGEWLWVWDPTSGRSIGVPLSDVTVTRAAGAPASCRQ